MATLLSISVAWSAGPPTITQQPVERTCSAGGFAAFGVRIATDLPVTCQWFKDGQRVVNSGSVAGADTTVLTIEPVSAAHAGVYHLAITNQSGGLTSAPARLKVAPFQIDSTVNLPSGRVVVFLSSQPGDACRIDVTTNFFTWNPLGFVTNRGETVSFVDSGPFGGDLRLYRLVLVRTLPVLTLHMAEPAQPARLIGYGRRGETYQVESSFDLEKWSSVASLTNLTGWIDVTVPTVSALGRRFYRVSSPQSERLVKNSGPQADSAPEVLTRPADISSIHP